MKLRATDIVRILRTYHILDDTQGTKLLRDVETIDHETWLEINVSVNGVIYTILYGVDIPQEPDEITTLLTTPNDTYIAQTLPSTLDDAWTIPFKAKSIAVVRRTPHTTRLDQYATRLHPEYSRSQWQRYIKDGQVAVNSSVVTSPSHLIGDDDTVSITMPRDDDQPPLELPVIYEDAHVIVIDKPAGILTHAKGASIAPGEQTVADFLRPRTSFAVDTNRAGIVHRLDRDTSGILIGAKDAETARLLQKQFSDRTVKKRYVAITDGVPQPSKALIDLPIARNPRKPSTFRVDANGKPAQTMYVATPLTDTHASVTLTPKTGRTHQLRVHMAHLGTPIHGDRVYGQAADRLYLHAHQLELTLPNGKRSTFTAPIPAAFQTFEEKAG